MRTLLRRIVSAGSQHGWSDSFVDGDTLDLGRGTDQQIHLADSSVALRHAQIHLGEQITLRARDTHDISVNGQVLRSAVLKAGDQIQLGQQRMTVLTPPDESVALALQIEAINEQPQGALDSSSFRMKLAEVRWLRQRPAAWMAFLALLALFLVVPLLVAQMPEWREPVRESPLPDDSAWLAGPLHSAHAFIGDDCQACHTKTFDRVDNEACIACHGKTARHVNPVHHDFPALEKKSCASCHHEHNEAPSLVVDEQPFCSDCHSNLSASANTDLKDARDFGAAHPPFRMSLRYLDTESMTWKQTPRLDVDATMREQSNLVFSHKEHLIEKGVKNEQGKREVLACSNCHKTERDSTQMQTGGMEENCQRCHSLSFDTTAPTRTVPHAKPDDVIASLREFYSQRFIDNIQEKAQATRRPGESAVGRLQSEGVAWVDAEVRRAATDLFERRACATCHEVKAVTRKGKRAWDITPVELNARWFPSAYFDHGKHESMVCADCHEAKKSDDASDVLMPKIETCRACHAGAESADASDGIASGCVSCHRFHLPQAGNFGDAVAPSPHTAAAP